MANKRFLLGILVMVLVFGIAVIGCDNDTTDNETLFNLSIAVAGGSQAMGSVSITAGSSTGNKQGASVTVTANPAANYHFVKWSNNIAGMASVSTSASYTFNISENTSLFAVFAPDNGTDGIINPEGTWKTTIQGSILQITFVSNKTWSITLPGYSDNGTYTLTGNYGEITSNSLGKIGMFALTSASTGTMYFVSPNPVVGTYYATKL